ncbi:MAG: hypothetical protein ACT4P6_09870 [Gemmatimonadaceae bacterium]
MIVASAFGATLVGACGDEPNAVPAVVAHGAHSDRIVASDALEAALRELKRLTRPYRSLKVAMAAGYNAQLTGCMESPPAGGMGFHYGDPRLIDATVEPLKPEILMYEPQANGDMLFVGVEYVVPYTAWSHDEPPSLLGVPLHRNDAFQLWVLHAWIAKPNPSGLLQDWNPRVSCQFAKPTT